MSQTITRHLVIHGKVQGVYYRGWTVEQARSRKVDGWVRNRMDGTVEALLSGETSAVEAMISACRSGPSAAQVSSIDITESDETPPPGFQQAPTL